jgi:DNA repair protein RecO (recombination protein O)
MSLAQVDKDRLVSALRAPVASSAFVLHRYDWSESSLILELFTLEKGRITALAKGAKRPYSQMRSVLLPFQRIHDHAISYSERQNSK